MKKLITCCILCILTCTAFAQEADTTSLAVDTLSSKTLTKKELRRQKVAKRNFHYNILGGPSFSPDFGFLVGGSALMTFRMNPKDTTMRRSVLPFAMAFIFKGGSVVFQERQIPHLRTILLQEYTRKLLWRGLLHQQKLCAK